MGRELMDSLFLEYQLHISALRQHKYHYPSVLNTPANNSLRKVQKLAQGCVDEFPIVTNLASHQKLPTYCRKAPSTSSYCVHSHINTSSLDQVRIVEPSLSEAVSAIVISPAHITSPSYNI